MANAFAYCRVSLGDHTLNDQMREIRAAGFAINPDRIITEIVSGTIAAVKRRGFSMLIGRLEAGDALVVTKVDRLGRNAMEVLATVERLEGKGVRVHCLALGSVDLTSAAGKMTMAVIATLADFERDLIIQRIRSESEKAKVSNRSPARRQVLSLENQHAVKAARAEGISVAALARQYSVSIGAIQRAQKRVLNDSTE